MPKFVAVWILVAFSFGCASARHVAVKADVAFSAAVFAVADAQSIACAPGGNLSPNACTMTTPPILKALADVKVVTAALQASTGTMPTSLPSLMRSLAEVQRIVSPLAYIGGPVGDLSTKISNAMDKAIALLTKIAAGGAQ